jgi:hypothetical protein
VFQEGDGYKEKPISLKVLYVRLILNDPKKRHKLQKYLTYCYKSGWITALNIHNCIISIAESYGAFNFKKTYSHTGKEDRIKTTHGSDSELAFKQVPSESLDL